MHVILCCSSSQLVSPCNFLPPWRPNTVFGSRSWSLIPYCDLIHMSISCLTLCQESTPIKWPFSVQSFPLLLIIAAYLIGSHKVRQKQIFVIVCLHDTPLHTGTCMCNKIAIPALEGVQEAFVRFLLLSLACHYYSRGFPLWKAVLIADGVVLAKYLVTVLKGWKMWEWRGVREGRKSPSFCFVLPHALWVHKWSL